METVRGCKWVDEIVADVPYIMNETYLKEIMVKHRYRLLRFSPYGMDQYLTIPNKIIMKLYFYSNGSTGLIL